MSLPVVVAFSLSCRMVWQRGCHHQDQIRSMGWPTYLCCAASGTTYFSSPAKHFLPNKPLQSDIQHTMQRNAMQWEGKQEKVVDGPCLPLSPSRSIASKIKSPNAYKSPRAGASFFKPNTFHTIVKRQLVQNKYVSEPKPRVLSHQPETCSTKKSIPES